MIVDPSISRSMLWNVTLRLITWVLYHMLVSMFSPLSIWNLNSFAFFKLFFVFTAMYSLWSKFQIAKRIEPSYEERSSGCTLFRMYFSFIIVFPSSLTHPDNCMPFLNRNAVNVSLPSKLKEIYSVMLIEFIVYGMKKNRYVDK